MKQPTEYHSILNVYKRDQATKHRTLIIGNWEAPEFEYLANNAWTWTEKIDGTNIRVCWDGENITFKGRTDDADMPLPLFKRLQELFPVDKVKEIFGNKKVVLYGEGYGYKIQKYGHLYLRNTQDFILFDVYINGLFLERTNVNDVALNLNILSVPVIGEGTLYDAIECARTGFKSMIGICDAEGLVCRPIRELRSRAGHRIICKIKTKTLQGEKINEIHRIV